MAPDSRSVDTLTSLHWAWEPHVGVHCMNRDTWCHGRISRKSKICQRRKTNMQAYHGFKSGSSWTSIWKKKSNQFWDRIIMVHIKLHATNSSAGKDFFSGHMGGRPQQKTDRWCNMYIVSIFYKSKENIAQLQLSTYKVPLGLQLVIQWNCMVWSAGQTTERTTNEHTRTF